MKHFVSISILFFIVLTGSSQDKQIPYTLADRDRLIQVEADVKALRNEMGSLRNEMNSLRKEMDAKLKAIDIQFAAMNQRLDTHETLMYWGFGILFSMMLFMLGFIIWDRRTTLAPVKSDIDELKKANEKMKDIFREHSKSHPQLAEILKSTGIL